MRFRRLSLSTQASDLTFFNSLVLASVDSPVLSDGFSPGVFRSSSPEACLDDQSDRQSRMIAKPDSRSACPDGHIPIG